MTAVAEHIAVPAARRDLDWLARALQSAVAIEHATLPLYLAAMFSLRVQNYTAYNALRSVAMEEMGHMATAANILAAIGGRPRIAALDPGFPRDGLPGGAEPDLRARLACLSRAQLRCFMRIESPGFLLAGGAAGQATAPGASELGGSEPGARSSRGSDGRGTEPYPSIASLYEAIAGAVQDNADELRAAIARGGGANQVGDDIGVQTIASGAATQSGDPLVQVRAAIAQIVEQGEGSPGHTLRAGASSEDEESHYCKFAELYHGHRYQQPALQLQLNAQTEPQFFAGAAVPFPEVVNTLAVPADGYRAVLAADPDGPAVAAALQALDASYSAMMSELDAAWNGPPADSWPTLGKAVAAMSTMRVQVCFHIVRHQIPAAVVARLPELYPAEHAELAALSDLSRPLFYGPRFSNLNRERLDQ